MSEHGDKMISEAQSKLRDHEQSVVDLKKFINQIREFEGQGPLYVDLDQKSDITIGAIRSDQFYGQPLATVVRQILVMRKAADAGAATVTEVYDKMIEGGYAFETDSPENAKRALRISLTKNPIFHRLPNGLYGLTEWYPNARPPRSRRPEVEGHDDTDESTGDSEPAVQNGNGSVEHPE